MRKAARLTAVVTSLALVAVACGGDDDAADEVVDTVADTADEMSDEMSDDMTEEMSDDMMACDTPREMSVQLQWSTQAQFAGSSGPRRTASASSTRLNGTRRSSSA